MKTLKRVRNVLLFVFILFLCLAVYSEQWFLTMWDSSVDFSTVIYQLFSPLKGTGAEVMDSYVNHCVFPTMLMVGILLALWHGWAFCRRKLAFAWEVRIFGRVVYVRHKKVFVYFWVIIGLCMLSYLAWKRAVAMGITSYIRQITNASVIFEEEYVAPDDVEMYFPQTPRNLILIYLESMETTYASVEDGGGKPENYILELTELAYENLFFSDDEDFGGASGDGAGFTMAALLAGSTGVPFKLGINGNTAGLYEKFLPGVVSLGDILQEHGYRNYFMCGSDIRFAGRDDFYRQHGDYSLIDFGTAKEDGFIASDYNNGFWGMEDEKLFEFAKEKLSEIAALEDPFNFTMLTVDSHHPDGYVCEYCGEQYEQQFANVLACSSRQTAAFVKWIQEQPWYENTTVILMGDHLSMKADFWDDIGEYERKVYNCFINVPDSVSFVETKNRTFTILDLFPTTLAAMGVEIEGDRLGLGVNLFSEQATIPEKMGIAEFDEQLGLYSNYYFEHFIVGR